MFLLRLFLARLITKGQLTVIDAGGGEHVFAGAEPGPHVTVRFADRAYPWRLFFAPELAAGEGYMDGRLMVEGGTIRDFLNLITLNMGWKPDNRLNANNARIKRVRNYFRQLNPADLSKRNAAHHYDLSNAFYEKLLDDSMQYSCAYFTADNAAKDLARAQRDKVALIAKKLRLAPGHHVLDVGCGWGGLAFGLHAVSGATVDGITLSEEQLAYAKRKAAEGGLSDKIRFSLTDYRSVTEEFDRIVSVGMFEHVGLPNYKHFFRQIYGNLKEEGVALLHTIGRADGPGITDAWTAKYIFPGGYAPSLSEIMKAVEQTGFYVTDIEVLRLHYAETLAAWQRNFAAHRAEFAEQFDERFCRMFEFYLAASEHAFRNIGHVVFQIQLAKQQDVVPLTRDYLCEAG